MVPDPNSGSTIRNCCTFSPQYDLSAAQFSPDGRVFQIEYAMKAVENSRCFYLIWSASEIHIGLVRGRHHLTFPLHTCSTAIAIRGKDGVVLGVEKLITSKLHEPTSNKRIFTIDKHIGVVS